MPKDDKEKTKEAKDFILGNRDLLYSKFADSSVYKSDPAPVTVFMAGSPGAGKTEISRGLVEEFEERAVRIDADEIRVLCPGYVGANAHLYQLAASIGVDILYEHCLKHKFNLVVDGTFSHAKTIPNIDKSLEKDRRVIIYFIYQDPKVAWDFTKKREVVESRRITKEMFIKGYCMSIIKVHEAKAQFGDQLELNLIIKDLDNEHVSTFKKNVLSIDPYLDKVYSEDELNELLL